jgi:hypothetical protein
MGWLGRLLRVTPKQDLIGIRLNLDKPCWVLEGKTDFPSLLRGLIDLLPDGSILYFEGGSPTGEQLKFLQSHAIPEQVHIAVSTLWPRPRCYHIPGTSDNLVQLAELTQSCAAPELAVHFHAYLNGKVLLEWHDAFAQPMLLSGDVPENKIRNFSETSRMQYALKQESAE